LANINFVDEESHYHMNEHGNDLKALQVSFQEYKTENAATLKDIRSSFEKFNTTLQRIATTLSGDPENDIDGLVTKVRKIQEEFEELRTREREYHKHHEDRIAKLEEVKHKIFAYSAAIAVVLTTMFNMAKFLFEMWAK